jgi:hypothetical protein
MKEELPETIPSFSVSFDDFFLVLYPMIAPLK